MGVYYRRILGQLILEYDPRKLPICTANKIGNLGVIQCVAASSDERLDEGNVVSRIIKLTIGVRDGTNQAFWVQLRHALQSFVSGEELARREAAGSREPVIDLQPNIEVAHIDPVIAWYKELQHSSEVGRVFQHADAFVQSAHQDVVFLKIESPDCLFQVPHSTMNDLGRCTGCCTGKIACL